MKDLRIFKECDPEDEWAGNYSLNDRRHTNLVRVVFGRPQPKDSWRVGVWGNDDFGMVKDFNIEEDADKCFLQIISLKIISIDALIELGFETF